MSEVRTILVVDDEETLRKAIAFDFKRKGFHVLEAGNGREALTLVQSQSVDVVLSDVRMSGGDGVELLENIKIHHAEIPVVMLVTGFADITVEDAYAKGADAVFTKPFNRKMLFEAIERSIVPREERWAARKFETSGYDFQVELHFPELNLALKSRVANVARGGMFVTLENPFPSPEARVFFKIRFDRGDLDAIEGEGVVRWVRTQAAEGYPKGCGIEFVHLSDSTRAQVIELIQRIRSRSFIPKN